MQPETIGHKKSDIWCALERVSLSRGGGDGAYRGLSSLLVELSSHQPPVHVEKYHLQHKAKYNGYHECLPTRKWDPYNNFWDNKTNKQNQKGDKRCTLWDPQEKVSSTKKISMKKARRRDMGTSNPPPEGKLPPHVDHTSHLVWGVTQGALTCSWWDAGQCTAGQTRKGQCPREKIVQKLLVRGCWYLHLSKRSNCTFLLLINQMKE